MNRLTGGDKVLCGLYAVLAVVALVWTQVLLVDHLRHGEGGLLDNLTPNAAATFAAVDLLAVALVGVVFIVVEGRRLGVRFTWVYVALSFLVAISVALPLFLIARQMTLAQQRTAPSVVEQPGERQRGGVSKTTTSGSGVSIHSGGDPSQP